MCRALPIVYRRHMGPLLPNARATHPQFADFILAAFNTRWCCCCIFQTSKELQSRELGRSAPANQMQCVPLFMSSVPFIAAYLFADLMGWIGGLRPVSIQVSEGGRGWGQRAFGQPTTAEIGRTGCTIQATIYNPNEGLYRPQRSSEEYQTVFLLLPAVQSSHLLDPSESVRSAALAATPSQQHRNGRANHKSKETLAAPGRAQLLFQRPGSMPKVPNTAACVPSRDLTPMVEDTPSGARACQ